jgi:hypothetical protein
MGQSVPPRCTKERPATLHCANQQAKAQGSLHPRTNLSSCWRRPAIGRWGIMLYVCRATQGVRSFWQLKASGGSPGACQTRAKGLLLPHLACRLVGSVVAMYHRRRRRPSSSSRKFHVIFPRLANAIRAWVLKLAVFHWRGWPMPWLQSQSGAD